MSLTNNCESLRSRRFIHLHERIAPLWGNPTLWRMPVGEGRRLAPVCEVAPGTNPSQFLATPRRRTTDFPRTAPMPRRQIPAASGLRGCDRALARG